MYMLTAGNLTVSSRTNNGIPIFDTETVSINVVV